MSRYRVRARQAMPGDDWFLVVWADDLQEVEGVRPTRELAEALADRLEKWADLKDKVLEDDSAAVWADPADLAGIVDGLAACEPSVQRVRELERQRLVIAQGMAA